MDGQIGKTGGSGSASSLVRQRRGQTVSDPGCIGGTCRYSRTLGQAKCLAMLLSASDPKRTVGNGRSSDFRARRGMIDLLESIAAMETIRHDGVCIVMTTQQPTYLDKHIRGLIGHSRAPSLRSAVRTPADLRPFRAQPGEGKPANPQARQAAEAAHGPVRIHGHGHRGEEDPVVLHRACHRPAGDSLRCLASVQRGGRFARRKVESRRDGRNQGRSG